MLRPSPLPDLKAQPVTYGEVHDFIEITPHGNALKIVVNARYPTVVIERPEFIPGIPRRT